MTQGHGKAAVLQQLEQLGTFVDRGGLESVDSNSTPASNSRENISARLSSRVVFMKRFLKISNVVYW
jgi:hypothetical protein